MVRAGEPESFDSLLFLSCQALHEGLGCLHPPGWEARLKAPPVRSQCGTHGAAGQHRNKRQNSFNEAKSAILAKLNQDTITDKRASVKRCSPENLICFGNQKFM
jgi:hypothetical protein